MGDTSIVMTAKELLDIAQGAISWTNCKQVQRTVAEVFRLRAKVREQAKTIKRLDSAAAWPTVTTAPVDVPYRGAVNRERDDEIARLRTGLAALRAGVIERAGEDDAADVTIAEIEALEAGTPWPVATTATNEEG